MSNNIDWSKLVTREMKIAKLMEIKRISDAFDENQWRNSEVIFITDQLIGIEDGDPTALPGTDTQWREYRTRVRAWKEGSYGFPDKTYRPTRPT